MPQKKDSFQPDSFQPDAPSGGDPKLDAIKAVQANYQSPKYPEGRESRNWLQVGSDVAASAVEGLTGPNPLGVIDKVKAIKGKDVLQFTDSLVNPISALQAAPERLKSLAGIAATPIKAVAKLGEAAGQGYSQGFSPDSPFWETSANGLAQTAAALPVAAAEKNIVQEGLQRGRVALAGGGTRYAEQQLAGGSGVSLPKERAELTRRIAPDVAEDPRAMAVNGHKFDQKTFQDFKAASAQLDAATKSLPPNTTLSKQNIIADLDSRIGALQVPTAPTLGAAPGSPPPVTSGHPDAVRALTAARDEISAFPDRIPIEDALKYRRQLDKAIYTGSGYSETAMSAEKAVMEAKRDVANAIRGELSAASTEMKVANETFSSAADKMNASNLSWDDGRRMSTIAAPSKAQKVAKIAAKTAVGGGVAGAAYEVYKHTK